MSHPEATRYESFAALRDAHLALLREAADEPHEDADTSHVEEFLRLARSTGALLDSSDERDAAEALLDYWAIHLHRAGRPFPETELDPFDAELLPELPEDACPYLGLQAFRREDTQFFFGRGAVVEAAIEKIERHHFLVVVGPSGCGKSSLVLAGVAPQLTSADRGSSRLTALVHRIVPGSEPLKSLARAVVADPTDSGALATCVTTLGSDPLHFRDLLALKVGGPALVVVDQFEELLTQGAHGDQQHAFALSLLRALEPGTQGFQNAVIITLRKDFERRLRGEIPELETLLPEARIALPPLTPGQLREAILKPAERVGLRFEDGLVEELIDDVVDEPAALPMLQFALLKLWKARRRNRATLAAYEKIGGGREALAHSAERLYASMLQEDREVVRQIFLRLVTPAGTSGNEVVSHRVDKRTLRAVYAEERVDKVIDDLKAEGLVRETRGDSGGRGERRPRVEITHEALVRNWPRVVEWLDDERVKGKERLRFAEAAQAWADNGRSSDRLLRGSALHEAINYERLSAIQEEFVEESRQARIRHRRVRRVLAGAVVVGLTLWTGLLWWQERQIERAQAAQMDAESETEFQILQVRRAESDLDDQLEELSDLRARYRALGDSLQRQLAR